MNDYFNFLSVRAFNAGAQAYKVGARRHPPMFLGTYSGEWVKGWDEACLSSRGLVPDEFVVFH